MSACLPACHCVHIGSQFVVCISVCITKFMVFSLRSPLWFPIRHDILFLLFFSLYIHTASMEHTWSQLNKTLETTYRIIDATCKLSYISKTSGKPFVSAPSTQDGCVYVWVCDFLCETHSQLDAYFIIRFWEEGINANMLSVSYSVHCLRLPSFAFWPRHIVCEFRLLSGFATTFASDSENVMTALWWSLPK